MQSESVVKLINRWTDKISAKNESQYEFFF